MYIFLFRHHLVVTLMVTVTVAHGVLMAMGILVLNWPRVTTLRHLKCVICRSDFDQLTIVDLKTRSQLRIGWQHLSLLH